MVYGQLLEQLYISLRQVKRRAVATGGSTTSIVDGALDDLWRDDEINDYPFFITRTTDGAAPQHEFGSISDYDEATETITTPTLGAAVGAGDRYTVMQSRYKVYEIEEIVNMALQELGFVPLVDVSLTTESNKTEYEMPVALQGLPIYKVEIQGNVNDSDDNQWERIALENKVPAAAGSAETLILQEQPPSGRIIRLWYGNFHPQMTTYSDTLNPYIRPQLAVAVCRFKVLEYLGTWDEEQEASLQIQRADSTYREMLNKFPVWTPNSKADFLNWGRW